MNSDEYQCAECQLVFKKAWSDEEAMKESVDNFGEIPADDLAVICDDCYNEMMGGVS